VLTEPRNALTRQYAKLLSMDGVELDFTEESLRELASQAMKKGTGTRALRSLMERLMLDLMYDLPGRDDISHVTITPEMVRGSGEPQLRLKEKEKKAAA
jgi:ATP-dependent Clp protease ATP-binding subunit ClpX